jgi:hypothetical protein
MLLGQPDTMRDEPYQIYVCMIDLITSSGASCFHKNLNAVAIYICMTPWYSLETSNQLGPINFIGMDG